MPNNSPWASRLSRTVTRTARWRPCARTRREPQDAKSVLPDVDRRTENAHFVPLLVDVVLPSASQQCETDSQTAGAASSDSNAARDHRLSFFDKG
jgi:hypothetical protein